MARIRTLDFLPEIFQTPTNSQFLAATLDQIVNEPNTMRVQGYIGSRLGYGVNALDYYVTEPTKARVDYQLDPSVVFTKPNETVAQDFITYPGLVDAVKMQGGLTDDNSQLFQSQIYSWDSFTNLDKLVNYNEYYWLPDGPPAVTVSPTEVFSTGEYVVTSYDNTYGLTLQGEAPSGPTNPAITLLRGGTYTFSVNQNTQFWIQTAPGTSGYSPIQANIPTREVYGVSNNGAETGFVTFDVPVSSAQNEFIFPGDNKVDVVSTTPFDQINGQILNSFIDPESGESYTGVNQIDGVNISDGMRILFYNTGVPAETGYISAYYGETTYDVNDPTITDAKTISIASTNASGNYLTIAAGHTTAELVVNQTITFGSGLMGGLSAGAVYFVKTILNDTDFVISDRIGGNTISLFNETGSMTANINQGQYQQGFYSVVSENFYRVTFVGDTNNPTIRLLPDGEIPVKENITATYGTQWINRGFYRNDFSVINLIPIITANLDVLYYQDGTNPNKVGMIRLVDASADNFIDVETQILGKKNYTSPIGVSLTNGLKVIFQGNISPSAYVNNEYYVEGVGTAIELIPVADLVCPEKFTTAEYNPWDILAYDEGKYDVNLNIPVEPDYITIARNSISKNAWSRSNRWFHTDVITATAAYNNNPSILTAYATLENKAKRPIIEFYPNLKLFNAGSVGKKAVDFFDTVSTDALSDVAGLRNYYPDTEAKTTNTAVIAGVTGTSTTITIPVGEITGAFQVGMYVADYNNLLPTNTQVQSIDVTDTTVELTVSWGSSKTIAGTTAVVVGTDSPVGNYAVFPGARIVFANDTDSEVRDNIYIVNFTNAANPVIVLSLAEDSTPLPDEMLAVNRGYYYQGASFYYDGLAWLAAQQKVTTNQAPLFDIFDSNGVSLGDPDVYTSTSFKGCKLFAYGIGAGLDDVILGFPVSYSSVDNIGDIQFDVSLNSQTFDYVSGTNSITENVNIGYVHSYTTPYTYDRLLGWKTAIAPSVQYQVFEFKFDPIAPVTSVTCDIAMTPELTFGEIGWARNQVFFNNEYQDPTNYTVTVGENTTTITFSVLPEVKSVIQVLLLSEQVSNTAYYTIPTNLNNNPLNQDITSTNLGDIRMQYMDIFVNAPGTTGTVFGINNFRDCGNLVSYGTKIIQNSASLVLPGAFLRKQDNSLIDALLFNSREYVKYKQLLVDTVQNSEYIQRYTPSDILDDAIDQISASRSEVNAFFWSDMLPSKAPYRSNTYSFNSMLDVTRFPLSKVYNFTSANYDSVLVYLTRAIEGVLVETQLLRNVDYIVDQDAPTVTITLDLIPGDTITIKEYNQTYGSYVPYTPSKLGLYKLYQPEVVLDVNYSQPTYFIKGHDGSYTKLYGKYEDGRLIDFRDQALLEFEKRIYNNCKLSTEVPIQLYDIVPGFFRESSYSWDQWIEMYSTSFLNWVGQNRIDYKTQYYQRNNEWTYNYTNSGNKLNGSPILQGYWRGVYEYFYDTTTPNATPWEMLGFANMPSWWTSRYGPAPYTSDNQVLWADLESGYVWNNGNPYTVAELARPGLSEIIPVDSNGDLLTPLNVLVGNYNPSTFQKDWKVGDDGPAELSYRRSSSYPFDVIKLFALTRPAELYNLGVDLDNYKYSAEFDQYLVNNRSHLVISDVEIYGNGIAKTSYINWIVDFQKQLGFDATSSITTMLDNLDVRLAYRLAGFSDKTLMNFYVEKGSPNNSNASLLIPDESYAVLLYENQPFDRLAYSSIVVQQNEGSWTVYGNSQNFAYFTTLKPTNNSAKEIINVGNLNVKVATNYTDNEVLVPYGTKFYSVQELAQFIMSYAAYLNSKGMKFNQVQNGVEMNWTLMVQEILYWVQTGWENGSIVTLNPAATDMFIDQTGSIVQPLTMYNQNFILNQDLYPIQLSDLCVNRDGTSFHVHTMNQGDSLSYGQFNLSNIEHGIVFDNVTLFNDVIYNLVTGLRQNRINLRGTKTAEWNGTVNAWGFILNQDNIQDWSKNIKYPKGVIVKYKNKYWTALNVVEPSAVFDEQEWKIVNYQDIQKGMLPNAASRAYESTLYYNRDKANLEQDSDLLSFSLIGYRPRDYLALADLTDITQVNVYQNMIKNKGTRNATYAFKGANLPQGGIDYEVYENWAIKAGEYGGVLNENFVEFKLNQNAMTGNPSIVSLTNGTYTTGSMQEVPLYSLFNYGRPVTDPNILSVLDPSTPSDILYPTAGYVNANDVRMSSFYYAGLPFAVDSSGANIPITDFYVRDYMWLANFKEHWNVYSWKSIGEVVQVRVNLNNTATVTFAAPHGLKQLDSLSIVNFATNVDGYYIVSEVVNINEVIINLAIPNATSAIQGRGIAMAINSQRVSKPSDIANMDLLESEFTKNTVWVDENTDGTWAVYRKSLNYQLTTSLTHANASTFGSAVAYAPEFGYLVSDASVGEVYRYDYDATLNQFKQNQVLSPAPSSTSTYGTAIAHAGSIFAVSQPNTAVYVYVQNESVVASDIIPYQTITAPGGVTDWGAALEFSGDSNWLYISNAANTKVYVYQKQQFEVNSGYFVTGQTYQISDVRNTDFTAIGAIENKVGITFVATGAGTGIGSATQVTYTLASIIDGSSTYNGANGFGNSISASYDGSVVVIGVPNVNYNDTITNWGNAVVYQRTVQKFEAVDAGYLGNPQFFNLIWTPVSTAKTVSSTNSSGNIVTLNNTTGLNVNDPIMFAGSNLVDTNIGEYVVYYVRSISGSDITLKTTRSTTTALSVTTKAGITGVSANAQTDLLYVYVNGVMVPDSNYAVIGNKLVYATTLNVGDVVTISDSQFNAVQTLTSQNNERLNIQFGYAQDISRSGTEIVVGSPYEIDSSNREGQVYRYTNVGSKFGVVIANAPANIISNSSVLINGFVVYLSAGSDTAMVVSAINSAGIPNIEAAVIDNKLVIQILDRNLSEINQQLVITSVDASVLTQLGIQVFKQTQVVTCPHVTGPTQFGKAIKFNDIDSIVVGAPVAIRYEGTTFDFTDDENLHNDTVFDNNSTRFVDEIPNAGAVYMFDLLSDYNGSEINPGAFVYAQPTNNIESINGSSPMYGSVLDFNEDVVIVGAPNFLPYIESGQATVYRNTTGVRDWIEYRQPCAVVDTAKIQNTQLFSAITNETLINLDYMDPIQGKLLGAVRENIDYVAKMDPASYNSDFAPLTGMTWGVEHVGEIWFNTNAVRYMNYHQNDAVYNSKYWGTLFPGSDVAVYTWVESNVPPSSYAGPGTPYDPNLYTVGSVLNSSNVVTPVYYFWVRNSGLISQKRGKSLADATIAAYIADPKNSGIAYMAPVLPNTFAIYNSGEYLNANDTVFHIGYANGTTDDVVHTEYTLIRENFSDDFLPGLPIITSTTDTEAYHGMYPTASSLEPTSLYARMLDSLSGCNRSGEVVPDPFLPLAVQSGVLVRPRQSFFFDRFGALKNYLQYANGVLVQYPITELKPDLSFLFAQGDSFDTTNYWQYTNWWAVGYGDSTRATFQVPIYADLVELNVALGTIAKVEKNGAGLYEIYRYDGSGVWTRVGLENGTIQFSSSLWDYETSKIGFGGDFFDTTPFDTYPSQETRQIIRALNEQIYTGDLVSYRNKSLILLFEYIQSETTESQNFLPWLNKTSLADVSHTIRELKPYEVFKSDNEAFLEGYINEVKPYHVVVKEFLFNYTGIEDYTGDLTDFDLPAMWNSSYNQFITPQLVYGNPTTQYEYAPSSDIWNNAAYSQWFSNQGLSLTGQNDVLMTRLAAYVPTGATFLLVENASGFPINGNVMIDDEIISYAYVDRALNVLGGIVRGAHGTSTADHLPGAEIRMDLPAVIVLDGGRGYVDPPKVEAYIDTTKYPAPAVPAQLTAVMAGDRVLSIDVVDPGKGYVVLPEIIVAPSQEIFFETSSINSMLHTINIYAPYLKTGDQVRFVAGTNGITPTKLVSGSWYYVGVLETTPSVIIALYSSYSDAVNDSARIEFVANVESDTMALLPGVRATTITSASPVRENNITIKFDRTSYTSQVTDWIEGAYYGAYFAGKFYNPNQVASSAYTLENTVPAISTILASSQGAPFEIVSVADDNSIDWSSYIRYISATVSSSGSITLVPQDRNNPNLSELMPNASGTTVGMVKNMPIKFEGQVVGGLQENVIYYVSEILSETSFRVSTSIDGASISLTDGAPIVNLLRCFTGETVGTTVITVNYPGIMPVTETTNTSASHNYLTVPMSPIGTGGTTGFYTELPVFFTGTVFGGVIENRTYYVTTVIDDERFTISETQVPVSTTITDTATTGEITVSSTTGFAVNNPVIFTGASFGGIIAGQTYYVSAITSNTTMTISESVNGTVVSYLTNATGSMQSTNQKDTVVLANETGNMIINVSLPISPGQINGQLFNFYQTSGQFPNLNPTDYGKLLSSLVTATIATSNRITLPYDQDTSTYYVNMPIQFTTAIGGLSTVTTYYLTSYSGDTVNGTNKTNLKVVSTSSVGNTLTCSATAPYDDTTALYVGMPIKFAGVGLGGVTIDDTYYIDSIVDSTRFTISATLGGSTYVVTTTSPSPDNYMVGTGDPFITISDSVGGLNVSLTTEIGISTDRFEQVHGIPEFSISYILGGYEVTITDPGFGFALDNTMLLPGTALGGVSPGNDLTLIVDEINSTGQILNVICSGTLPVESQQYYLQVRSPNTLAVYRNSGMTVPVPTNEFNFQGFTTSTVTKVTSTDDTFYIADTSLFSVNDQIVFTGNVVSEITPNVPYFIYEILSMNTFTVSTIPGDVASKVNIATSVDPTNFTVAKAGSFAFLPEPFHFNESIVKFNNRLYVCVVSNNDAEFVLGKWEQINSDYPTLNAMDRASGYYTPTANMPGLDLTQLFDGTTFPYPTVKGNAFQPDQQYPIDTIIQDTPFDSSTTPQYTIQGPEFLYGYGPEELVPGNITDNIAMIVSTRPGVDWPGVEYGHTGFNVVSVEISPTQYQTVFSFDNVVETPAQLTLQSVSASTGLGTTIYPTQYSVNWVNKTITLTTPLTFGNKLRIDVYEVGNGDQIVKANTDTDPIRLNDTSLFTEIYVNCEYSQDFYQGSGVIRTGSSSIVTRVTATDETTNRIMCDDVTDFLINKSITFQGVPFGGLQEDTVYYVKTISYATNSITVSLTTSGGIAGPTVDLTTATGTMFANIENGNGVPWTTPYVYHNGSRLVLGTTGVATRTKASPDNTITTNTTGGLNVNDPITFCQCSFGGIVGLQRYYIASIKDNNEFTISATVGGPTVTLIDAIGNSRFITYDYAFGIQPDGVSAMIMFPVSTYTNEQDYIVYSLFGETRPDQFGYSVPEIQYITSDGSASYDLTNFIGGSNPENAIVELNGVRLSNDQYSISILTNTITFSLSVSGMIMTMDMPNQTVSLTTYSPTAGSNISVLTYNDTSRQYLNSQYNVSGKVSAISVINNVIASPITGKLNATTAGTNQITVSSSGGTTGLVSGQTVMFKGNGGATFGGLNTTGVVYFVDTVVDATHFTVKDYNGTQVVLTNATASIGNDLSFEVGNPPQLASLQQSAGSTTRITTATPHGLVDNNVIRIDGVSGSTQLNNNTFYVKYITPTVFDIYSQPYTYTQYADNYPVIGVSSYIGGGYVWRSGSFFLADTTATATSSINNRITVDSVEGLVSGTPVYFSQTYSAFGDILMGSLVQGTEYYIKDVFDNDTITISSTRYGEDLVLTDGTGTVNVTQWSQENVNRLWVTINGYRVPSSNLRLNDANEVSILAPIATTDEIIITNMIPTAIPSEQIYMNLVTATGEPTVYNCNANTRTWLTQQLNQLDDEIHVFDATRVTDTVTQSVVTPSISSGYYYIGLDVDKRLLSSVSIRNITTGEDISSSNYEIVLTDIAPQVKITAGSWISQGDTLMIVSLEGNTIFINGEQIKFAQIDITNNVLSGLERGANGTAIQTVIPEYVDVFGMLSSNMLPSVYYDQTWNSYVYNTEKGDPLQISQTVPATFLNTDII